MQTLRIGTRGSRLALWQANHISERLRAFASSRSVELVEIQTAGDQDRTAPLAQIGGEGLFTKEIQRALLARTVDVAVHSLKDLPTVPVDGLVLAAVPKRGSSGDVFVSHKHRSFDSLPPGARVATGSQRRRSQVLHHRPDLELVQIRGNVETRLRKLDEQDLDSLILAQAGLERLGLQGSITEVLDPAWMVPAVGQGALGLECRSDDAETIALLERLNDEATRQEVRAERALLFALGGGCQVPIGGSGRAAAGQLTLRGCVLSPDGKRRIDDAVTGALADAEELGRTLAQLLLKQGARELLA